MGNMFDNLGKGLNDFTKQAGKIAGNIGDTAGKITKDVAKGAGKIANDAGKLAGDAGKMTAAVAGSVAQSAAVASGEVSKAADSMAKGTVSIAKNVKDSADKVDLFNSKLRAKAVEDYNNAVERYENVADDLAKSTQALCFGNRSSNHGTYGCNGCGHHLRCSFDRYCHFCIIRSCSK